MPISFILHEYSLNHGLILYVSNCLEWVNSSQFDSDQRELSRNIFDSNLELSGCNSNLHNFRAQMFQLRNLLALNTPPRRCHLFRRPPLIIILPLLILPIPALRFLQNLTYAVPFLPRDQPQIICKKNLKFGINSEETP